MSVVLVNGSAHLRGCTFNALNVVAKALNENGIKTEIFQVGSKPITGCIGCFQCRNSGFCEQFKDDKVNEFIRLVDEKNFDGYVFGAPVYYAAANGSITSFLNRVFFASLQTKLVGKPGAAIVNARSGGCSATFDQLNKYFTISSMPVVSSLYWNETHGMTPKEQNEDLDGIKTLKVLGENMTWLIKCIKLGKEHGIDFPKRKLHKPNEYRNSNNDFD